MGTVRVPDCPTCRRGSSNYVEKYNEEPGGGGANGWWFCSNARSPHGWDENGALRWVGEPCRTNHCPECGPRNARQYEVGLHLVQPTVFITLNDVAPDHYLGRKRMTVFRRTCNEHGKQFENAYTFERYVERGHRGLHVHLLGHGDLPSLDVMAHAAAKAGFEPLRAGQRVNCQRVRHHGNLGYLLKSAKDPLTRPAFLYDNGGRLLSTTRGFWKTSDGRVVRGGVKGFLKAVGAEQ